MKDCIPLIFDITLLVPVTVRVSADDEEEATKTGVSYPITLLPTGNVIAVSVGFPESITVSEVVSPAQAVGRKSG